MAKKKALITGITGQDGSYLAELLLEKDYDVVGLVRRSSTSNLERITHLLGNHNLSLIDGEVSDFFSVYSIIESGDFDEVYNLAAQSHVGVSFKQPMYTFDVNIKGPMNLLEAIRKFSPYTRFYQASTSELFGSNFKQVGNKKVQDEDTPFKPQSPYACSKLAAHDMVRIYREGYGLHASSGILFNHECFKYDTPVIVRSLGVIDIMSVEDLAIWACGFNRSSDNKTGTKVSSVEAWDNNNWTNVKYVSWFKNKDKNLNIINSRNSIYCVSDDHKCILEDNTVLKSDDLGVGDKVKLCDFPEEPFLNSISIEEAELMGMIVGDGSVSSSRQFTNKDQSVLDRFIYLWEVVTGGKSKYYPSTSGFTNEVVGRLDLSGGESWLRSHKFYSNSKSVYGHRYKVIPTAVLNSDKDIMEAFLVGYNACDGLKKSPCKYKFKNFKTNSPILASGLVYLISKVTRQKYNLTIEESWTHGKQQFYYSINLLSNRENSAEKYRKVKELLELGYSQRGIYRETGISRKFINKVKNGYSPNSSHHLELCNNEIKKIIKVDSKSYDNYFFDLETETNTLSAGVGQAVVHNSERRGEQFVTRKITKWIADFYCWFNQRGSDYSWLIEDKDEVYFGGRVSRDQLLQFPKLRLGNLDAYRDWGYAKDYVYAMWSMVQKNIPSDYIISTGETHSVRDFLREAFDEIGIEDFEKYVYIDPEFYRPSEVDYLCGDSSRAKTELNWSPSVTFKDLVKKMVWSDINAKEEVLSKEKV